MSTIYTNSPASTVTVSNINAATSTATVTSGPWTYNTGSINLGTIFDNTYNYHPDVKKYEVFESPEDVIALSVTWKRLRDNNSSQSGNLLDKYLFEKVTNSDREIANKIRDYYSKKFMMKTLVGNGDSLSNFRKAIYKIINSDGKLITQDAIGPVYYLPMFYEYDKNVDEVKTQVSVHLPNDQGYETHTKPLTTIKRVEKKMKQTATIEYWFKDNNNFATVISITKDNPLLAVWDQIFSKSKVLQIKGMYRPTRLDNFEYYSIKNWSLADS